MTITISPLEWRTLPFAGVPTIVAIRQVQTPDGTLAQGFVVDRPALTRWLATRAGEMVAELHPDDVRAAAVAAGWGLTVEPNPGTIARATGDSDAVARTFLIRFVVIGSIATFAAGLVLLFVMRAEKLARERSQFAAAAAHELRTPLAGLQLYGDMIADGLGDPGKLHDYARRMSEDAARLGRVVSNMLGFSQLERGNLSVEAQVGPLGEILREIAERARPALDRAGAALDVDVASELRARFDRDALERIVGNLLDNAERYARSADDRTIRLAALDRGDHRRGHRPGSRSRHRRQDEAVPRVLARRARQRQSRRSRPWTCPVEVTRPRDGRRVVVQATRRRWGDIRAAVASHITALCRAKLVSPPKSKY